MFRLCRRFRYFLQFLRFRVKLKKLRVRFHNGSVCGHVAEVLVHNWRFYFVFVSQSLARQDARLWRHQKVEMLQGRLVLCQDLTFVRFSRLNTLGLTSFGSQRKRTLICLCLARLENLNAGLGQRRGLDLE